ncbi:hypothetical protein CHISP_3013 [Chitinispirillum alkaliphilum]|nr:hypothetical protein CHISP_3013 [Chitinispirillum alkaliphilum]
MVERDESAVRRSGDIWYKRISWSAIFAGVFVAIVIQFTLTVLGVAIGLAAIDPFGETDPGGLTIGAAIWFVITGIISLFCGGWVTGRLSGDVVKLDRALHGLVVWSLAVLISFYLAVTTASVLVGGIFTIVESGFEAVGEAAPVMQELSQELAGPESPIQEIQQEAQQIIQELQEADEEEREEMQQALQQIWAAINQLVTEGEISPQNRENLVSALAEYTDMSQNEAESRVDEWVEEVEEIRVEVMQRVEDAREAAMQAAIWLFVILILGAAAAVIGATLAGNPDLRSP